MIEHLSEERRATLVSAMSKVERLLQASFVRLEIEDPASANAQWCLEQYFAELNERFETGLNRAAVLPAEPEELRPPAGVFIVAKLRDQLVGCGAVKLHGRAPAELKRMWVSPAARGIVYASVTSQIINSIEQGVGNWRMPWHTSGRFAFSPINVTSRKFYRGINTLCLWTAAQQKGYERGEWGTYKQWQEHGAQVRKGEKATTVVFWKFANSSGETQEDGDEQPVSGSRLLFTRGYSVFNAAQVDGYTPKAAPETPTIERIEQAEAFFKSVGANVRHGGNQAFYAPASDHIQMPPFPAFKESIGYYSTLAHEHTHWTSPASRLR